jgi:prevent-host-death family protein
LYDYRNILMREAFEAKNRFGALLEVEHGEEIVITRRGKPVPKLVPAERVAEADALAPRLWPLEAMNGLCYWSPNGADASMPPGEHRPAGFLRALPISLDDETANQAWTTTMGLAERFALSAHDLLDEDLRAAAIDLSLAVLGS